jgi:hypothetical protein
MLRCSLYPQSQPLDHSGAGPDRGRPRGERVPIRRARHNITRACHGVDKHARDLSARSGLMPERDRRVSRRIADKIQNRR